MPARYFSTDGADADVRLLPSHLRGDRELAELAEVVEAEIVAQFTRGTFQDPIYAPRVSYGLPSPFLAEGPYAGAYDLGDGRFVCLRGYHDDPAQATAGLRDAMKREIAHVLRWRLALQRRAPGVTSESDGEQSKSFSDAAANGALFPPGAFPLHLRPFVIEPVTYSL
jgi:hypothetical protein